MHDRRAGGRKSTTTSKCNPRWTNINFKQNIKARHKERDEGGGRIDSDSGREFQTPSQRYLPATIMEEKGKYYFI